MTSNKPLFETKVAELLAVTKNLTVPQILVLRRMTLNDPASLKWASERELGVVFEVILDRALEPLGSDTLSAAAEQHFDPLLAPGSESEVDGDRWLLFDRAKKFIVKKPAAAPAEVVIETSIEIPEDDEPIAFNNFGQLFDETIVRSCRRALAVMVAAGNRPHMPVPFALHKEFAAGYEAVLRKYVLPDIRKTRRIRELAESRRWDANGSSRILGIIQAADNPILAAWNNRWEAFQPEGVGSKLKAANDPWGLFQEGAEEGKYAVPTLQDLSILQSIIRWEAELLADGWREIALYYQQEFAPKDKNDQARAGSCRDAIARVVNRVPAHGGAFLAVRAFLDLPKVDRQFLRSVIQTVGQSDTERRRRAPELIRYFENLPK
jgi:hypothetical protein